MCSELYKQYFDELPCYLTVQNKDLQITQANRQFQQDFGEFEDRYCYQVYKHRPKVCEVCPVQRTFHDGQRHQSEELVTTLDGREVSVIVNTTPIRNETGEITAVMEMSTDITEIKNLQRQLRESQSEYQLLFDRAPCYISVQDKDLRIIEANRLHREKFGTFYGCKCYKVYKHREKECDPCIVRHTFQDGLVHVHEEVVVGQDNQPVNVMVYTMPMKNAAGEIENVMEMSADITQIRELQSKVSSIGLLISTISHDLKGLLNGLDGGIYLVDTGLKKNNQERVEKGWEMVQRNVGQIRSAVLDILYYARDREPEWESVSAEELAEGAYQTLLTKAADNQVKLVKESNSGVGEFIADPSAVKALLVNLMDNSIDACRRDLGKDEHSVSLCLKGTRDSIIFEVADNGIGMNQEVREKAFTLFFSSKGAGGTGLGLFIANKIAHTHGGNITIESQEGRGSKFILELPRQQSESSVPSKDIAIADSE